MFTASTLRAVALEQSVGELAPEQALVSVERMIRNQRVIPLEGGRFTTRAQRERELAIQRHITTLATDPHRVVVRDRDRTLAERVVAERIAAPLTREQRDALETITGPERVAVLIGPAGTGKGVVIDAAARAEQHAGRADDRRRGVRFDGGAPRPRQPRACGQDDDRRRAHRTRRPQRPDRPADHGLSGRGRDDRLQASGTSHEPGRAVGREAGRDRRQPPTPLDRRRRHVRPHHPTRPDQPARGNPPHQRPRATTRMGLPARRPARARDGLLPLQRPTLPARHPRPGRRSRRRALGPTHRAPRHRRGRDPHRRVKPRTPPPQRPRPTPPTGTRRTRRPRSSNYTASPTACGKATVSRSSPNTTPPANDASRTAAAPPSPPSPTTASRSSSTAPPVASPSTTRTRRSCGSTTPATSTANKAPPSTTRSSSPAAGKPAERATYVEASRARQRTEWFIARDELGNEGQDPDRITRLAEHMRNSRAHTTTLDHHTIDYDHDRLQGPSLSPELNRPRIPSLTRLLAGPDRHDRGPDRDDGHDRGR